jgi:hypothetical protein
MKGPDLISVLSFMFIILIFMSCSTEYYSIEENDVAMNHSEFNFEIEAKEGKTINLNYDFSFERGSLALLIQNSDKDTLLYQMHTRKLKGIYFVTKSDTNNYTGKIIVDEFSGSFNILCASARF